MKYKVLCKFKVSPLGADEPLYTDNLSRKELVIVFWYVKLRQVAWVLVSMVCIVYIASLPHML